MPSFSKSIIIGHCGADIDCRTTKNGVATARFSVAVNKRFNDEEKTYWHRVVTFGKTAEIARDRFKKGALVFVEGEHEPDKYVDKEGVTKYTCDLVAKSVRWLRGDNHLSEDKAAMDAFAEPVELPGDEDPFKGDDIDF